MFSVNKHGTINHCFDSKFWPYGLMFHPQVEKNECSILLLLLYLCSLSESKEDRFSNICHLSQPPDSKNPFSQNSSNQNDFF